MEAEKILLGQMLLDNRIAIDVRLSGDEFTTNESKIIFNAIKSCIDEGLEADIISISSRVKNMPVHKISELTTNLASTANWKFYQDEIKKHYTKRRLLYLADTIKNETTEHNIDEVIEKIETELMDITKDIENKHTHTFKEYIPKFIEEIEKRYHAKGQLPGISTGLDLLDSYILGFQKKFLYYIGARPSGGKSAMLLNMAIHAMIKENKIIGFLSAESSMQEISVRSFAQIIKVNSMDILKGELSRKAFSGISTFGELCSQTNGFVCDEPNMSLSVLKTEIRKMVKINGCEIIFIDYVQLISNLKHDNTRDRVTETSIALKMLARELDIPIIAAAQLKRDAENKRPTIADFADSSQLEKDADVAMMIYHNGDDTYLCIEKARDGACGDISLFFKKEYVSFYQRQGGSNE